MIKICHMTSAHAPEDDRIYCKEAVSCAKNGYDTYLVCRGSSYEKNGVHIVGVGEPGGGRFSRMTSFAKKIYQTALALNADIYHFHDPELLPYGLKLKKNGKKVVFDSHEKYTDQIRAKSYIPAVFRNLVANLYGKYEDMVLRSIDGAIIPCTFDGRNPFYGKCRRSVVLANYPILEELYDRFSPDSYKEANSACYIGGLTESRGISYCMKACFQAGATLHLAGDFSPPEYKQQLMQSPAYQCVVYEGRLNRTQIATLLATSQVGLCLMQDVGQYLKSETMGVKAYEYMSMGLPIVMSHSPYNTAMMQQYQFGICVMPDNIEEIANAIRYLLSHPDEAKKMGTNGRRAVKEQFNWGIEEKKLFDLYEDIIKE